MSSKLVQLWSDEPSSIDFLAFGAVAETSVEAALDDALGISGPWGIGKAACRFASNRGNNGNAPLGTANGGGRSFGAGPGFAVTNVPSIQPTRSSFPHHRFLWNSKRSGEDY